MTLERKRAVLLEAEADVARAKRAGCAVSDLETRLRKLRDAFGMAPRPGDTASA